VPTAPEFELELPERDALEEGQEVDIGDHDLSLPEAGPPDEGDENKDSFELAIRELPSDPDAEVQNELDIGVSSLMKTLEAEDERLGAGEDDTERVEVDSGIAFDFSEESRDESMLELGAEELESLPALAPEDDDDAPGEEQVLLPSAPEGSLLRSPGLSVEWLLLGQSCSALTAGPSSVVVAGERIVSFGEPLFSRSLEGASVSSLSIDADGSLELATPRGILHFSEERGLRNIDAPDSLRSGAHPLQLARAGGTGPLLARLNSGALLQRRSETWERFETGGSVRSLAVSGSAITLLVIAARPTLQISNDAGVSFRELLLSESAASVALGDEPLAQGAGSVIALADAARGLCVSADGGSSFRWVTGAVNVTALCVAEVGGAACVFAAAYSEARDHSLILLVEPQTGSATIVAELCGDGNDDAEAGETGRTRALIWHGDALWAAGEYGLAKLRP
jgi:hypothetical protein